MRRKSLRGFLLLFPAAVLPTATAGAATSPEDDIAAYLRMMWGLLIVLAVILLLYGLFRKRLSILGRHSGRAIRILEIQPLMPRKSLCLVEVRGREYLLGVGNDNITLLAALDAESGTPFQEILETSRTGHQS